jgi:hypothetical protein
MTAPVRTPLCATSDTASEVPAIRLREAPRSVRDADVAGKRVFA